MDTAIMQKAFYPYGAQESIRKVMKKYDFDQSALVCDYDDGMKGIMSKDILGIPTPVLFEDEEVWEYRNTMPICHRNTEIT